VTIVQNCCVGIHTFVFFRYNGHKWMSVPMTTDEFKQ
jgi:hypothetical protein